MQFVVCFQYNRRTLDPFSGKIYYFYALIYERLNQFSTIRDELLSLHRTATLQHNETGQATLIVALLRVYLLQHSYHLADSFRSKTTFPQHGSSAQFARYLYYTGRIQVVQLHYSDALTSFQQALRKAPQKTAIGFREICTKYLILTQLLMGDIPERSLFTTRDLKQSLLPYFQLTSAVRIGDLQLFSSVQNKYQEVFQRDETYTLIVRLRSNVIKAGLRKINLAYSRISIKDIATKLKFPSTEDAEYMIVKAIHDGVIESSVNRSEGVVISRSDLDVYGSSDPQSAFHKRIKFTMDLHNETVKSLRFPEGAHQLGAVKDEEDDDDDETNAETAKEEKKEEKKEDEKKDTKKKD